MNMRKYTEFMWEEFIPFMKANNKKPFAMQLREVIALYKKYKAIPYQYFKSRLYLIDSSNDVMSYISPALIANLQEKLNDKSMRKYVNDKHKFHVFMEKQGLPVVRELLRIDHSGAIFDCNQNSVTRAEAEEIVRTHGKNVFVKPAGGSFGEGAHVHKYGTSIASLVDLSQTLLIQPIIQQHKTIAELHPSSLNTVRIDTLNINGEISHNAAVLKMGVNDMVVDNLRAGSLVVGIDLKTGRLYPEGTRSTKYEVTKLASHPNTKIEFGGIVVPYWTDVIEVTKRAAQALQGLGTLGWDVAITPEGPLLVEANIYWGANLMQNGWGGLGNTGIGNLAREKWTSSLAR